MQFQYSSYTAVTIYEFMREEIAVRNLLQINWYWLPQL